MRGVELRDVVDKKVGPKQFGVSVGLGYGNASKALLIFSAAFMQIRADVGLLKGEISLESTDSGDSTAATEEDAESPDCWEVLDGTGLSLNELLHAQGGATSGFVCCKSQCRFVKTGASRNAR